jgi:glycosyltransferase involved in cell wall biosynthesis
MTSLNVAVVVPGFSANESDWCIPALLEYVRCMSQLASVHVFTLRWPEWSGHYSVFGARVHALGGRAHLGLGAAALWLKAVREIQIEHRKRAFDIVHAFWADEPGWVAVLAGRILKIPVVVSLAGGELSGLKDIGYGLQLLPGRKAFVRWCLDSANVITAGSQYMLSLAEKTQGPGVRTKLRWAPLGVDVSRFRLSPQPALGSNTPRVLNVGSLTLVKNQRLLIDAFQFVAKGSIALAGQGAMDRLLRVHAGQRGMADRVVFLGEVRHDEMPELYPSAPLLVQTSRHEAQGMAVLEAAACGLAVCGTPVGALADIGIPVEDVGQLAVQINTLLDNPGLTAARGRTMREAVMMSYTLSSATARFLGIYETC